MLVRLAVVAIHTVWLAGIRIESVPYMHKNGMHLQFSKQQCANYHQHSRQFSVVVVVVVVL